MAFSVFIWLQCLFASHLNRRRSWNNNCKDLLNTNVFRTGRKAFKVRIPHQIPFSCLTRFNGRHNIYVIRREWMKKTSDRKHEKGCENFADPFRTSRHTMLRLTHCDLIAATAKVAKESPFIKWKCHVFWERWIIGIPIGIRSSHSLALILYILARC